jgi:hypothetical protein
LKIGDIVILNKRKNTPESLPINTTLSLHMTTTQTYNLITLDVYRFSYLKSFYYFHSILKALGIFCIKLLFHTLELNYFFKDLRLMFSSLQGVNIPVKDIPIVKVQVTLESFEKILVMGQLKVSF